MRKVALGVVAAVVCVAIGIYLWRSFDRAPRPATGPLPTRDAQVIGGRERACVPPAIRPQQV